MELLEVAEADSSSLISNFRIRTTHFTWGCCYKFKHNRTLFHFAANLSNTVITNTHTNTLIAPWYYFYITKRVTFYDAAMLLFLWGDVRNFSSSGVGSVQLSHPAHKTTPKVASFSAIKFSTPSFSPSPVNPPTLPFHFHLLPFHASSLAQFFCPCAKLFKREGKSLFCIKKARKKGGW